MVMEPTDGSEYAVVRQEMREAQHTALREQLTSLRRVRDRLTELLAQSEGSEEVVRLAKILLKVTRSERRAVRLASEIRYPWLMEAGAISRDEEDLAFFAAPVFCEICRAYYDFSCPLHDPGNLHGEEPCEWLGFSE